MLFPVEEWGREGHVVPVDIVSAAFPFFPANWNYAKQITSLEGILFIDSD